MRAVPEEVLDLRRDVEGHLRELRVEGARHGAARAAVR